MQLTVMSWSVLFRRAKLEMVLCRRLRLQVL